MKKFQPFVLAVLFDYVIICFAQGNVPLRLVQTIPMPKVEGRLDHMGVDIKGKRLFVAGLGNNSLEVIDLQAGKRIQSIAGFSKPQGVFYVESMKKLFVANGTDGTCKVLKGKPAKLTNSLKLSLGADLMDYDGETKVLYVGYGGRDDGKDFGEVAIVDTSKEIRAGDIQTSAHPGGMALEKKGSRLFLTIPENDSIVVIDRKSQKIVQTWPVSAAQQPVSLALDEVHHRLFVGLRKPPKFVVLDSNSGSVVTAIESVGLIDGVSFDPAHNRIYVSGGEGFVSVYQQRDPDHYEGLGRIATAPIARTSLFVPELNRLYVAIPKKDDRDAEIRVFEPVP
jgi:DNA-binding beta-propeller fold protein YncE